MEAESPGDVALPSSAAERCSEKLTDLVVILTTKLDNSMEDLKGRFEENLVESQRRFERLQEGYEAEVARLGAELESAKSFNQELGSCTVVKLQNQTAIFYPRFPLQIALLSNSVSNSFYLTLTYNVAHKF